MKRVQYLFFISVLSVFLGACSEPNEAFTNDSLSPNNAMAPQTPAAESSGNPSAAAAYFAFEPQEVVRGASEPVERKTVITADLDFETNNVRQALAAIDTLAMKHKGFVSFSKINTYTDNGQSYRQADGNTLKITRYSHQADMTIRIPRSEVRKFLFDVQQHIVFLDKQVFRAEDVVLDLRRQALEADRQKQLAANLDVSNQQIAQKQNNPPAVASAVSSAAASQTATQTTPQFVPPPAPPIVPSSGNKRQEEYALIQREYWQDRIDFATITMRFKQPEAVLKQNFPNPDAMAEQHKLGFNAMLAPMLKQGWSGFLGVVLFFIGIWPLALGVPLLWLGWKRWQQATQAEHNEDDVFAPEPRKENIEKNDNKKLPPRSYFDDEDDDF